METGTVRVRGTEHTHQAEAERIGKIHRWTRERGTAKGKRKKWKDKVGQTELSEARDERFICRSRRKIPGPRTFLLSSCPLLLRDSNSKSLVPLLCLPTIWSSQVWLYPRAGAALPPTCLRTSAHMVVATQVHRDFSFRTQLFGVQEHHGVRHSVQ